MTGTVESTCTSTPCRSQSSRRRSGSQQLSSIVAEELAVDDHAGAAGAVVLELDEAAVAVALAQVGPGLRQDVRVQIDLHG